MSTKKQIAANRRNAKKSTGPRSARGKAVSRLNALSHGLRARLPLPDLDLKAESKFMEFFCRSHQPQTPEQSDSVWEMAYATWHVRYWLQTEIRLLSDGPGDDPLEHARVLDLMRIRQGRYQRMFSKAFERYQRSLRAPRRPRVHPPREIA